MGMDTYLEILEFMPLVQDDIATAISIAKMLDEYLEASDDTRLPVRVETIVLQYVLSWLHSTNLDLRCISLKILLTIRNFWIACQKGTQQWVGDRCETSSVVGICK